MPFEWTVNPYRGCTPACVYCFARKTHSYLDLAIGIGFGTQIVVKVNAPEVLRRQLASPRRQGEHIAMGSTSTAISAPRTVGRQQWSPLTRPNTQEAPPMRHGGDTQAGLCGRTHKRVKLHQP